MANKYWVSTSSTDSALAANYLPATIPADGDTLIFDERGTANCTTNMDHTGVDLAGLVVKSGSTITIGNLASAATGLGDGPLVFECSAGEVVIESTGTYHLMCGDDVADSIVKDLIINNASAIVNLSSQRNAAASFSSAWTNVYVKDVGTLTIEGNTTKSTSAQDGTIVDNLFVIPDAGGPTIIVGDQCEDFGNTTHTRWHVAGGTVTTHSEIDTADVYGGTFNIGSAAIDMDSNDDNIITVLTQWGGVVNWAPQNVNNASTSPSITLLNLYAGIFSGANMKGTIQMGLAPTITTLNQWGGEVNLDNGHANFIVSTYKKRAGTVRASLGQALTLS